MRYKCAKCQLAILTNKLFVCLAIALRLVIGFQIFKR